MALIYFIFSPGSGRHPSDLRSRPGTRRGRAAGTLAARGGASLGAGVARAACGSEPLLGHRSVKPAATPRGSKPTLAPFSSPQSWKTQTRGPKLGNPGPCEAAARSRSRTTAGAAGSRPGTEHPEGLEPLHPPPGRGGLRAPRGWPAAQGSPPPCVLRPGSGSRPRRPGSAGMPGESCGAGIFLDSRSPVSMGPAAGVTVFLLLPTLTLSASLDVPPSPARPRRWPLPGASRGAAPGAGAAAGPAMGPSAAAAGWGQHRHLLPPQPQQRGPGGQAAVRHPPGLHPFPLAFRDPLRSACSGMAVGFYFSRTSASPWGRARVLPSPLRPASAGL